MLTKRHEYMLQLTQVLGSYASQVQLAAKEGYTDSAKAAEDSLIDIVNLAYSCNFINLNSIKINHPGIDWRETRYRTGLQVTVTEEGSKIKDSIDSVIRNKVETSSEIWFLLITTNGHGNTRKHGKYSARTITINDIVRQISVLPDKAFFLAVESVKEKLSRWFMPHEKILPHVRKPQLLLHPPLAFIDYHNLRDRREPKNDILQAVTNQLNDFIKSFSNLPTPVRAIIAKIVHHAPAQDNRVRPLRIELTEFYYHLSEKEQGELNDMILIMKQNHHGSIHQSNPRFADDGDDDGVTIHYDHHVELAWSVCEPDMNIYTALKSFYLQHLDASKLYSALENAAFSELATPS